MPAMRLKLTLCFAACGLLSLVGCGDSELAPTVGVAKLDGQPLVEGRIVFRPIDGGYTSIGQITDDGSFVMLVENSKRGAQIGKNHVLVVDARTDPAKDDESYRGPQTAQVDVIADKTNDVVINVRTEDGWTPISD